MPTLMLQNSHDQQMDQRLAEISRTAAMSEMTTGVLHNVGNVLNSVNVSVTLLRDNLKKSHLGDVGRVADLLRAHQGDLASFLTQDPKGQRVVDFLSQLSGQLLREQAAQARELESLHSNLTHIKEIVSLQQNCAKISGLTEIVPICDLVEDTIRLNADSFSRNEIHIIRDFADAPRIIVDKHRVLQILLNLIRNAKTACEQAGGINRQITVAVRTSSDRVRISVEDNGVGIPPQNLPLLFSHGFTTRKGGHGFGLHSGALAAKEIGGSLTASSEGLGRGSVFTLELPLQPPVH